MESCHLDTGLLTLLIVGAVVLIIVLAAATRKHPSSRKPHVAPTQQSHRHLTPEEEKWRCGNCGHQNDEFAIVCAGCGVFKEAQYNADYAGAGANDFGGDPLWDDDQGLM